MSGGNIKIPVAMGEGDALYIFLHLTPVVDLC
jgi:hypothetical protein